VWCAINTKNYFGVCFGLQKKNQRTTFFYFLAFYWKNLLYIFLRAFVCAFGILFEFLHRKTARENFLKIN
jgi:hypothetical protein